MTAARSTPITQVEREKLQARRRRATALRALLEFISAVSALLCLWDLALIWGVPFVIGVSLSLASIVFLGLSALTVIGGVIWIVKTILDAEERLKKELDLITECDDLRLTQQNKIKILQDSLISSKLDPAEAAFIRAEIKKITEAVVAPADDEPEPKKSLAGKIWDGCKQIASYSLSFFSGVGTVFGIAGSILGAAVLPALFATPVGWIIIGAVILSAIAVGIGMVYVDFYLNKSQKESMSELKAEKLQFVVSNQRLDDLQKRVDWVKDRNPEKKIARERSVSLGARPSTLFARPAAVTPENIPPMTARKTQF